MAVKNISMAGVDVITASYEKTAKDVAMILKRRHKLTAAQAHEAILASPLEAVFQSDPEMAAHTSNEAWAREIFSYWKKNCNC